MNIAIFILSVLVKDSCVTFLVHPGPIFFVLFVCLLSSSPGLCLAITSLNLAIALILALALTLALGPCPDLGPSHCLDF